MCQVLVILGHTYKLTSKRSGVGGVGWGRGWMFFCQTSGIVGPDEAGSKHNGSLTDVSFSPLRVSSFPSDRSIFFHFSCGETYRGSSKRRGECCFIYFLKFPCEKNSLLVRCAIPSLPLDEETNDPLLACIYSLSRDGTPPLHAIM